MEGFPWDPVLAALREAKAGKKSIGPVAARIHSLLGETDETLELLLQYRKKEITEGDFLATMEVAISMVATNGGEPVVSVDELKHMIFKISDDLTLYDIWYELLEKLKINNRIRAVVGLVGDESIDHLDGAVRLEDKMDASTWGAIHLALTSLKNGQLPEFRVAMDMYNQLGIPNHTMELLLQFKKGEIDELELFQTLEAGASMIAGGDEREPVITDAVKEIISTISVSSLSDELWYKLLKELNAYDVICEVVESVASGSLTEEDAILRLMLKLQRKSEHLVVEECALGGDEKEEVENRGSDAEQEAQREIVVNQRRTRQRTRSLKDIYDSTRRIA